MDNTNELEDENAPTDGEDEWEKDVIDELKILGASSSPQGKKSINKTKASVMSMGSVLQDIKEDENLDTMAVDNICDGGAGTSEMQQLAIYNAKRDDDIFLR